MSEEMNNELEEVIIVTATDDDGNEVNYQEVQRIDIDGKVFALLVEVPDSEDDDADDDGYAIECERRGGKLVFRLGDWFSNRFELFLRINESYTRVYVEADVPL